MPAAECNYVEPRVATCGACQPMATMAAERAVLPLRLLVLQLLILTIDLACSATADPAGRPNILFVVYDDLRPQLSTFGHDGMKTPHFDSLAAESLVFHRAYTNYPYCAPSRNRSVPL